MGAVKDTVTDEQVVMYVDKDGWYGWTTASFWDKPEHVQYISTRKEIERFNDLYEVLAACDAFNQMLHGQTHKPLYLQEKP